MEQIRFFLTEYAVGITTAAWGLLFLLLLTTLHKIRRIGRQLRELGKAAEQLQTVMEAGERNALAVWKAKTDFLEETAESGEAETVQRPVEKRKESPEALLDAVLGEVFP